MHSLGTASVRYARYGRARGPLIGVRVCLRISVNILFPPFQLRGQSGCVMHGNPQTASDACRLPSRHPLWCKHFSPCSTQRNSTEFSSRQLSSIWYIMVWHMRMSSSLGMRGTRIQSLLVWLKCTNKFQAWIGLRAGICQRLQG